jgi:hypothetical protein
MKEDEIYVGTKIWFKNHGFIPLAGQPPNGCDNIPTIEIKSGNNQEKGSRGSFKPDLVFANNSFFIIVECKPFDDKGDELKLIEVINSQERKKLLFDEINQRGILKRKKLEMYYENLNIFASKLRICLAHSGQPRIMSKAMTLSIKSMSGDGVLTHAEDANFSIKF